MYGKNIYVICKQASLSKKNIQRIHDTTISIVYSKNDEKTPMFSKYLSKGPFKYM